MPDNILTVRSLRKRYGELEAVKGIDFEVAPGEIFALIGPNGAGKTTTLRIVATILRPTSGEVTVDGIDAVRKPDAVRELISYLPEEAGAYKNLTAIGYLRFVAEVFFDDRKHVDSAIARARELADLGDRINDKLGSFSKGMTRKLLLARTVMTQPKLAILDEPTSGLDVINAIELREAVKSLARGGMSVLLSSHNMLEIEFLSDRVSLIADGIIHETGTPSELKAKYGAENLEQVFAEVVEGKPRPGEQGPGASGPPQATPSPTGVAR
jgi:ABC-2 type transport system ATP-binding protein